MKKTLALLLVCCLLTGCSDRTVMYDDTSDSSDMSSHMSAHALPKDSEPEDDPTVDTPNIGASSGSTSSSSSSSSEPQSSSSSSSSKPQSSSSSSSSKPQSSSSSTSSKPQSSSSSTSSKPQSSSSSTSSKPQSSSSSTSSKPQSSSSSSSSKPQSSASSSSTSTIANDYGRRAQEAWEVEFADEVFKLVNEERAKEGLPAFKKMASLTKAATIRAWECLVDYGHERPDGQGYETTLTEQGINFKACGENIAAGQKTPQEVVTAWMNSPGHRTNILSNEYEYLGVGFYCDTEGKGGGYKYYWAQNFCKLR